MSNSGYLVVERNDLEKACNSYFEDRRKKIDREREKQIEKMMNKKLFAPKNRKEAIKRLEANVWNEYNMCALNDLTRASMVEECLAMCSYKNSDKITISSEVAQILHPYWEEK